MCRRERPALTLPLVNSSLLKSDLGVMTTPWWLMDKAMRCPITRNSAEIPFGAHGADYVCESTGIFLTIGKELVMIGTPWWLMVSTMRCPILANRLRPLSELMVPITSASTRVSSSLVGELEVERLLGG